MTEMPGKRWQVLMVEGGVIVLSILMAFGIDAWWAERQRTQLVRDALTGVADEIRSAESELASNGSVHLRHVQNTAALAETLAVHPASATVVVPDSLVAGLFEQYVSDPPMAVVSSFVSAGLVEDLGSLDLRRAILVWITSIQDQRDDQRLAREYGSLEIQPFLRAEFDVTGPQRMVRTMTRSSRQAAPGAEASTTELRVSPRLRNLVGWQLDHLDRIARQNSALQDHAKDLLTLIHEELGPR